MNTRHHGERGEQNAAERGADSQTIGRKKFQSSTHLFQIFSCFDALDEHVVFIIIAFANYVRNKGNTTLQMLFAWIFFTRWLREASAVQG